tara:strand:- start:18923 stop:19714 length:792 start_codon:yes stop_codon:yes gene_type:complete
MLISSLSGCLDSDEEDDEKVIDLVVYYESTSGTIQQSFIGGSQISLTGVSLNFDFARTTSDFDLATFSLEPGDGRSPIIVNADESASIDVDYELHGLFSVILTATDVEENSENMTVVIRIEQHIEWNEQNSAEPDVMQINTEPDNDGPAPKVLQIKSTVENIENLGGLAGSPITITWELTDSNAESKGMKTEQIADGQDAVWDFSLNFPERGVHELSVQLDQSTDQERVNVNHVIDILYEQTESAVNPFPTESGTEGSQTESE